MTQNDDGGTNRNTHHRGLAARWLPPILQLTKFGAVGTIGVVVNFAVFNALWLTVFNPSALRHGPLLATVVATLSAIVVNWFGNRYWAFAAERRRNAVREGLEFFAASLVALLFPLICIGASRYLLGLHSLLADNIASNVVGLVLGTIVRYLLYKFWVYSPRRAGRQDAGHPAGITDVPGDGTSASRLVRPQVESPSAE